MEKYNFKYIPLSSGQYALFHNIFLRYILYDDMCHLGPFSQNPVVLNLNEVTRFFGSRHLAVDCLHFLNHKDKV